MIKESSVSFDIKRKLTDTELQETVRYCRHDVQQTIKVFLERIDDFNAQFELLKMFNMPLSNISKTKVQLSAQILEAAKPLKPYNDEFDISFPETMRIKKYKSVVEWYKNPANRKYNIYPLNPKSKKMQLEIESARKTGEQDAALKAAEDRQVLEAEKKKIENKLAELEKSIVGRDEQIAGLEKKLRNADSATTAFKVCLEGFITAYDRCIEYVGKIIDADDKERCETALSRAVERMAQGG